MQVSAIETLEVSLLCRLLHRFDQLSESGQRLQELLLELLAVLFSTTNDGTNLGVASSVSLCSGRFATPCPAPLRAATCYHARPDYIIPRSGGSALRTAWPYSRSG